MRDNPDKAQHRIAEALSRCIGTSVDPWGVKLWPARGYWTHTQQDVQRWTGQATVEGVTYTLGSWNLTLAAVRKGARFEVFDGRGDSRAYANFTFEPKDRP